MKTRILIPTDLTIESLNTLKLALAQLPDVEVVLVYPCILSNSISDLLFYSPSKILQQKMSQDFYAALEILKNHFESQLHSLKVELFHGNGLSALKNFLGANQIDSIYLPSRFQFKWEENSFDIVKLLLKTNLPIHKIDWQPQTIAIGGLSSIFSFQNN